VRRSNVLAGWLATATMVAAHTLPAQENRLASRLDPATLAEVSHIADSARTVGLPVEPLFDKALEGATKRADGTRIIAAVRGLAHRLGAARTALGPTTSESELVAAAGALFQGVSAADLTRLRIARNGQSVALPLVVLTDLIERGVPAGTATAVVVDVARTGAGDPVFVALRRDVDQDITAGAPPAIAAATRARGTIAAFPPAPTRAVSGVSAGAGTPGTQQKPPGKP
jgi:hypothetical protein